MKPVVSLSTLLVGTATAAAGTARKVVKAKKLPDTGKDWVTLSNGVQFQPAGDYDEHHPLVQQQQQQQRPSPLRSGGDNSRQLEKAWNEYFGNVQDSVKGSMSTTGPYSKIFIDGGNTFYNEYAQAWRALGWYIDCDYCIDEDGNTCWENFATYAGEYNYNWDYYNQQNNNNNEYQNRGCQRFMLWAAYVDTEYEGNGMNEYMYYNRHTWRWDNRACTEANSTRCVKMDCHEPNTHYSLLGFFKEPDWGTWMDTLARTQGDCVLSDEEYRLMRKTRDYFPTNGCTKTPFMSEQQQMIYMDLKPAEYGEMSIGLYTDAQCITEYQTPDEDDENDNADGQLTPEGVIRDMICFGYIEMDEEEVAKWGCTNNEDYNNNAEEEDNSNVAVRSYTLQQELKAYNKAFNVFKLCQPCKTYDLTGHISGGLNYQRSDDRYYDENGEQIEDIFNCQTYGGINQCMVFTQESAMLTASFKDIELAGNQGSIAGVKVNQISYGKTDREMIRSTVNTALSWALLFFSAIMFGVSCSFLLKARAMKRRADEAALKEPLVPNSNGVQA